MSSIFPNTVSTQNFKNGKFATAFVYGSAIRQLPSIRDFLQQNEMEILFTQPIADKVWLSLYEQYANSSWFERKLHLVSKQDSMCIGIIGNASVPSRLNKLKGSPYGSDVGTLRALLMNSEDVRVAKSGAVFNTKFHTTDQEHLLRDLLASLSPETLQNYFTPEFTSYLLSRSLVYTEQRNSSLAAYLRNKLYTGQIGHPKIKIARLSNGYFGTAGATVHMRLLNRVLSETERTNCEHIYFGPGSNSEVIKPDSLRLHRIDSQTIDADGRYFSKDEAKITELLQRLEDEKGGLDMGFLHVVNLAHGAAFRKFFSARGLPYALINHLSPPIVRRQSNDPAINGCSHIGTVANSLRDDAIGRKERLLRNIVDPIFMNNQRRSKPKTCPDKLELLIVGRICPAKGQHVALAVLQNLRLSGIDAKLNIIGETEDETYELNLNRKVEALKLEVHVDFLGAVTQSIVKKWMDRSDLLLFPSTYPEGIPRVVLEAQAIGLPVAFYEQPCSEDWTHPRATYACSAPNPEALSQKVFSFLNDMKAQKFRKGSSFIAQQYSKEAASQRHLKWIRELYQRKLSMEDSDEIDAYALKYGRGFPIPNDFLLKQEIAKGFECPLTEIEIGRVIQARTSFSSPILPINVNGNKFALRFYKGADEKEILARENIRKKLSAQQSAKSLQLSGPAFRSRPFLEVLRFCEHGTIATIEDWIECCEGLSCKDLSVDKGCDNFIVATLGEYFLDMRDNTKPIPLSSEEEILLRSNSGVPYLASKLAAAKDAGLVSQHWIDALENALGKLASCPDETITTTCITFGDLRLRNLFVRRKINPGLIALDRSLHLAPPILLFTGFVQEKFAERKGKYRALDPHFIEDRDFLSFISQIKREYLVNDLEIKTLLSNVAFRAAKRIENDVAFVTKGYLPIAYFHDQFEITVNFVCQVADDIINM